MPTPHRVKKYAILRQDLVLELLFLTLLVTPFQNIVDVLWMFNDSLVSNGSAFVNPEWLVVKTPGSIKIIKDLILVLLFFAFFLRLKTLSSFSKKALSALILILVYGSLRAFLNKTPLVIVLSGIRWYLPILLFPMFDDFRIDREDFLKFFNRYKYIMYVSLVLQIFQILFSGRWGRCTTYLIGCRSSGFFAMPQPMSLFGLFFLILALELPKEIQQKKDYLVSVASIMLTKSAAGFLGLGALLFFKVKTKFKIITFIFSLIIMITFPLMTGRADFWNSPMIRLKVLQEINFSKIVFGTYTNSCFNFFKDDICTVPDSFFVGLLGNLGLYLTVLIMILICYYIHKSKRYFHFATLLIILVSGSYTEYFPINILFPLMIGLRISEPHDKI